MFVIDTNVFIYDTFENSIYFDEAKEILDSLLTWIVPDIVILEYVWFLKNILPVEEIEYKVKELFLSKKTKVIKTSIVDYLFSLNVIKLEKISLSRFNDKVILSIARRFGGLASFDRKLRAQAKKFKIEVMPKSLQ